MKLKDLNQDLPTNPGVYLFKNAIGEILYVGKANNLKKRVSSYFNKSLKDRPWIEVMMPSITQVETVVVHTETEALLLEATLIKQHLPRFNIKLTDDKAFPYIKLISNEPVARFTVVRKQHNTTGVKYFGPYLSARAGLHTLEFLRRIYGIHISSTPLPPNKDRACFHCSMYGFTCPLAGEVNEEKYMGRVQKAVDFLEGKRRNLVSDVEDQMLQAAEHHNFELAAKLRDRLASIKHVSSSQQVISVNPDSYDAISVVSTNTLACLALLPVRDGQVTGGMTFFFNIEKDQENNEVIRQFLISLYPQFSDIPSQVIISQKLKDQSVIEKLLSETIGHKVVLKIAQRGDKKQVVDLASKNAQIKLDLKLIKEDQSAIGLVALKELLNLPVMPERIEAVDISNLGSSEPVGAIVCFIHGQPDKNEYRRFNIKTVEGQNDFAMIREVVLRRFSDTNRVVPDLFVVDGGPEQLKFAVEGIEQAPLKPKFLISLAKKPDRIFLPSKKLPLRVPRGHKGLLLLSRIRDEVHRFGITFHRKKQQKKSLRS